MSTANVRNVLRVRGRLVANPTDIVNLAFPYGGTALGLVRDIEFVPKIQTKEIWAEEWGTPVDVVYGGERAALSAVLREFDQDAVTRIFPNATSTEFDLPVIESALADPTGTKRAGMLLSDKEFKLLFAPEAADSHPFLVMYKVIPRPDEAMTLQFSLGEEMGLAVSFIGKPDLTKGGKVYQIGPRRSLTL